jgi:hypothetical protein
VKEGIRGQFHVSLFVVSTVRPGQLQYKGLKKPRHKRGNKKEAL